MTKRTEQDAITKQRIIADLVRSPHGKLDEYLPVGVKAVRENEEFYAHLLSWSAIKSEVRDAKVALPVIGLLHSTTDVFVENAAAHVANLNPRLFLKAMTFRPGPGGGKLRQRLVERYLRDGETAGPTERDRIVLQHRESLKRLYALFHIKPSDFMNAVVLKGEAPAGTVFDIVRRLSTMDPLEAAGQIAAKKIPFLIAAGALKDKMKSPDVVLALIQRMSPTELVTNTKRLEALGVRAVPSLRAAFDAALAKAATSRKATPSLKASRAASALAEAGESVLVAKMQALQEKQLDRISVEGNWLVLADKSGSMSTAIKVAIEIAGLLARVAKGTVSLVFFDVSPRALDVTGKTLDEIKQITQHVAAGGGTSIGCGLDWALQRRLDIDGIAVVSDGGENHAPVFAQVYDQYAKMMSKQPPVYFYQLTGDVDRFTGNCRQGGVHVDTFDLRSGTVDFYSLPNLAQSMRTNRYSLADEVMEMPLLTLDDVLKRTKGTHVHGTRRTAQV